MNIKEMIKKYQDDGISDVLAVAKVCQEIILHKIYESDMAGNVTIKGGVVMMNLSKDKRRATRDLDLDFIKYSISNESIEKFINKLDKSKDNIKIEIESIKELKHEDYKEKQVMAAFSDEYDNHYVFKLDIGVHANLDLEQDEIYFDL